MNKPLNISRPFIHDKNLLFKILNKSINKGIFTNNGPNLRSLENKLKKKIDNQNLSLVSNGTLGLNLAIKALDISGEIITTPFTYIATSSSIIWSACKPIYCDISLETFNIDADKIESLINKNTKAIIATHVFGNPCEISKINRIAKKYTLKVIYDASHCWNVIFNGKSILNYGDVSVISFNATKIFHTIEGGACIAKNNKIIKKINSMRFFGYDEKKNLKYYGINAKMSEFHAAVGMVNYKNSTNVHKKYKYIYKFYQKHLRDNKYIFFQTNTNLENHNFSYFPIIFYNKSIKKKVIYRLNKIKIFPREYFDISLDKVYGNNDIKKSNYLASRILCLPIHSFVKNSQLANICSIINNI